LGRIDVRIPDDLEKMFREEIFRRKGMKKGNITDAFKEAIILWMQKRTNP